MALAAMDSEPVEMPLDYLQGHKDGLEWASQLAEANHPETGDWLYDDPIELAKAIRKGPDMPPVQPAPVVPDDVLKALQKVARIRLDMDGFDGDRRGIADCLCDAEEALIEVVTRRAAMFNHPEQHLDMVDHSGDVNEKGGDGNSPVIPDGWTCNDKANAALMMLDRIETVDPVDDDRIDGIKRIVRELAAAPHDTPALNSIQSVDTVADRWIPVSERMPEVGVKVLCFPAEDEPIHAVFNGQLWLQDVSWSASYEPIDNVIPITVTHWMPLPAAPQEVNRE
ncbi:DUF551 domain-containing protein [Klebsiella sp. K804]|uniref:DUF551 domain-containing protein n=2 Tax=Klebsiella/Raoultella group TaxID=2890311 RepID=UPI003C2C1CC5